MKNFIKLNTITLSLFLLILGTIVNAQSLISPEQFESLPEDQQVLYLQLQTIIRNSGPIVNPNTGLPQGISEDLEINLNPEIPKPKEPVSIYIESFSTDLNSSFIQWVEDGVVITEGQGVTNFSTIAPSSGRQKTISLNITKINGATIQKEIIFTPSEVNLVYEAQTYTPPFYKGGSLFTSESDILFVAVPNLKSLDGISIDPKTLIYTWKIDNKVISSISGTGKDTFLYNSPLLQRPMTVSVEVTSINGTLQAVDSVYIEQSEPEIIIYEKNPVYGTMFEKAIKGDFLLDREEIELSAVPYFFDTYSKNNTHLTYTWLMNGQDTNNNPSQQSLVFRNEDGSQGTASVEVLVDHIQNILQSGEAQVTLDFSDFNLSNFEF